MRLVSELQQVLSVRVDATFFSFLQYSVRGFERLEIGGRIMGEAVE